MFFKDRKEKREQELNENRLKKELGFAALIEEADKLEDPAKKILALRKISNTITDDLVSDAKAMSKKAGKSGTKAWLGTWGTGVATASSAFLLTGPVGMSVTIAGMAIALSASYADLKRKRFVAKKLIHQADTHIERMGALIVLSEATIAETVEKNVDAISTSPSREKVLALSGLSDQFAAAAAKHIAEARKAAAEEKPVAEEVIKKEPKLTKKNPTI